MERFTGSRVVGNHIKLSSRLRPSKKTYIVGLDGSELSFRSVQTAAQLMNDMNDNLVIVTLGKKDSDKEIFERFKSRAQEVAMKNHVPHMRIYCEYIQIPDSYTIENALMSLVNHHHNGASILVIGAAGKGDEDRKGRKPEGQPPIGHLALACLQRAKVPVVLVKSGPKVDLDVTRVKRQGRDGTSGLNFLVTMDGSMVSQIAFDHACRMAAKADTLYGLHVADSDAANQPMIDEFETLLAKVADSKTCAKAEFICQPKHLSIREHIEEVIDSKHIDVVVMGSVELSNPTKGHFLGSVASAVTKASLAHCCVVKHFATT